MNPVKTYDKVNSKEANSSFSISKMESIYEKRNGVIDEPHRHDFFTVLIVINGKGLHKIDFNTYKLSKKQIFFVAPGQVHQVIEEEKSFGYAMTFSNQFLLESSIPLSFINSLNLFHEYGQSPPLTPDNSSFDTIVNFTENIFELFNSDVNMKSLSIGAFLKLLLIECNNICSISPIESDIDTTGTNLIRAFKNSVDLNYKKEHSTTFYAN